MIHEKIIAETEGIKTSDIIKPSTSREIQGTMHGIYIHDFLAIGVNVAEVCDEANEAGRGVLKRCSRTHSTSRR